MSVWQLETSIHGLKKHTSLVSMQKSPFMKKVCTHYLHAVRTVQDSSAHSENSFNGLWERLNWRTILKSLR